jgi:hypothetical protein
MEIDTLGNDNFLLISLSVHWITIVIELVDLKKKNRFRRYFDSLAWAWEEKKRAVHIFHICFKLVGDLSRRGEDVGGHWTPRSSTYPAAPLCQLLALGCIQTVKKSTHRAQYVCCCLLGPFLRVYTNGYQNFNRYRYQLENAKIWSIKKLAMKLSWLSVSKSGMTNFFIDPQPWIWPSIGTQPILG